MAPSPSMEEKDVLNFAKKLASNEKTQRDRAVKKLKKWLHHKSEASTGFSDEELLKLWKGLHYCFWMSDKPLIQEELADMLSRLIHVLQSRDVLYAFLHAFLSTEAREWPTLDTFRLDKYMMLIRCYFKEVLVHLKKHEWNEQEIKKILEVFSKTLLNCNLESVPEGLKLHFIDIYLDELTQAGHEELNADQVYTFLEPYLQQMAKIKSQTILNRLVKRIFDEIVNLEEVRQLAAQAQSDEEDVSAESGEEDEHAQNETKGDIETGMEVGEEESREEEEGEEEEEDMEMEEGSDLGEEDEEVLEVPPMLEFDLKRIADTLFAGASHKSCLKKNRKLIYATVTRLRDAVEGMFAHEELDTSDDEQEFYQSVDQARTALVKEEIREIKQTRQEKQAERKERKQKRKLDNAQQEAEPQKKRKEVEPQERKSKNKFKDKKGKKQKETEEPDDSNQPIEGVNSDEENPELQENDMELDTTLENTDDLPTSCSEEPEVGTKKKRKRRKRNRKSSISDTDTTANTSKEFDEVAFDNAEIDSKPEKKNAKVKTPAKDKSSGQIASTVDNESGSTNLSSKKKKKNKLKQSEMDSTSKEDGHSNDVQVKSNTGKTAGTTINTKGNKKSAKSTMITTSKTEKKETITMTPKETLDDNQVENKQKSPAKKKRKRKSSSPEKQPEVTKSDEEKNKAALEEEVEIWIPNKKYKGKYKDWFSQQAAGDVSSNVTTDDDDMGKENLSKSRRRSAPAGSSFATFEAGKSPPAAFVKKAMVKAQPKAKGKTKIASAEENTPSSDPKRRVSFGLHKNCAQTPKDKEDEDSDSSDISLTTSRDLIDRTTSYLGIEKTSRGPTSLSLARPPILGGSRATRAGSVDIHVSGADVSSTHSKNSGDFAEKHTERSLNCDGNLDTSPLPHEHTCGFPAEQVQNSDDGLKHPLSDTFENESEVSNPSDHKRFDDATDDSSSETEIKFDKNRATVSFSRIDANNIVRKPLKKHHPKVFLFDSSSDDTDNDMEETMTASNRDAKKPLEKLGYEVFDFKNSDSSDVTEENTEDTVTESDTSVKKMRRKSKRIEDTEHLICKDKVTSAKDKTQKESTLRRSKRNVAAYDDGDSDDCMIVDVVAQTDEVRQKHVNPHSLHESDREALAYGEWLSDIHVNLAQALLRKQFPKMHGLENCGLGSTGKKHYFSALKSGNFIQLFNTHGSHWVTLTNVCCDPGTVRVYDTLYRSVSADTKYALKTILANILQKAKLRVISIIMPAVQRQPNYSDCGVFAIAIATSLLHKQDPAKTYYKVGQMRTHLKHCFDEQKMTLFPCQESFVKRLAHKTLTVKVPSPKIGKKKCLP